MSGAMLRLTQSIPPFPEPERRASSFSNQVGFRRRLLQAGAVAAVAGMLVLPLTRTGISVQENLAARFEGLEQARQLVLARAFDATRSAQGLGAAEEDTPTAGTSNRGLAKLAGYLNNADKQRIGLSPSPLVMAIASLGGSGTEETARREPGQFRRIERPGLDPKNIDFAPTASVPETSGDRMPPLARPHGIPAERLRAIAQAAHPTSVNGGFETPKANGAFTQVTIEQVALARPSAAPTQAAR